MKEKYYNRVEGNDIEINEILSVDNDNSVKGVPRKIINDSSTTYSNENDVNTQHHTPKDKINEDTTLILNQGKKNDQPLHNHSLKYRADIDGLRTIAIGIVLIFHAWPKTLVGGFVGVDVFFVISGYLISSIIFKEYSQNKFSYINFYYRRIKRLFPALILVMFSVMVIAYYLLWDNEIKALSKTVIAGSLFSANLQILFLKKGYFDPDTQENPLLHLWSLGVEEQFYLIWPFIAYLLVQFVNSKFKSYLMISFMFAISFVGNIFAVHTNAKWAYYFPLCRFWEMVIGGCIALVNHNNKEENERAQAEIEEENKFFSADNFMSFLGVFLIIFSAFIINENSLFPGFWAVLPTAGSALLICSRNGFLNKYLLSSELFVFIGKISYPLYLWHWPLLVFGKSFFKNSPSIPYPVAIIVALSILLSILTYYCIEKPSNNIKNSKIMVILLTTGMTIILFMGVLFFSNPVNFSRLSIIRNRFNSNFKEKSTTLDTKDIFPDDLKNHYYTKNSTSIQKLMINTFYDENGLYERLTPIQDITSPHYSYLGKHKTYIFNGNNKISKNNKKVLIVGDSFAEMLYFRIKYIHDSQLIKNFPTVIFKVVSGSWIAYPCNDDEVVKDNLRAHNEVIEYIKREKPMSVLFSTKPYSGYYPEIIDDDETPDVQNRCIITSNKNPKKYSRNKIIDLNKKLTKNLKSITDMGIRVYMNTLKPEGDLYSPKNMFNNFGVIEEHIQPLSYNGYMKNYQSFKDIVDKTIRDSGVKRIDYSDNMCKDDICPLIDKDGFTINRDETHLSQTFVKKYLNVIDRAFMDEDN